MASVKDNTPVHCASSSRYRCTKSRAEEGPDKILKERKIFISEKIVFFAERNLSGELDFDDIVATFGARKYRKLVPETAFH